MQAGGSTIDLIDQSDGQLLMVGGVAITIIILTLGVVSLSLVDITVPIEKKLYIKPEFDNVRKEFGVALEERLGDLSKYSVDTIKLHFNETLDSFVYVEALRGNYFNASYEGILYKNHVPSGLFVTLTLMNADERVNEEVAYVFSSDD